MNEGYRYKKRESVESKEVFRATLGFDFIFSKDEEGNLHCWCIEINGENTGIYGAQDIPNENLSSMDKNRKIGADIRMQRNPNFAERNYQWKGIIDDYLKGDLDALTEGQLSQYYERTMADIPMFKHSYSHSGMFYEFLTDKANLKVFVPEEHRPKDFVPGDSYESSTGYWVVKPRFGKLGRDIRVLSNEDLKLFIKNCEGLLEEVIKSVVIQELLEDYHVEADGYRRSMRYLVDFAYLEDGSIRVDYAYGYNRRAGEKDEGSKSSFNEENKSLIVNRATGAVSETVTKEEMTLAAETAEEIIHQIAEVLANR